MQKSKDTSRTSYTDHNPTQLVKEGGEVVNPDQSERLSLEYTESGGTRWKVDNEEVSMEDGFALTTGMDKVPKIGTFAGFGEGKMRKAYESEKDYNTRMEK